MNPNNGVGAELRACREEVRWSLEETCRRAKNVDVSRLSKFERNLLPMRRDQIEAVEKVLKVEMAVRSRRLAQVVAGWPSSEKKRVARPADRVAV